MATLTRILLVLTCAVSFNCAFEQNRVAINRVRPFVAWSDILSPSRTRTRNSGQGIVPVHLQEIRNNIDSYPNPSDIDTSLRARNKRAIPLTTEHSDLTLSTEKVPQNTSSASVSSTLNSKTTDTGQGKATSTYKPGETSVESTLHSSTTHKPAETPHTSTTPQSAESRSTSRNSVSSKHPLTTETLNESDEPTTQAWIIGDAPSSSSASTSKPPAVTQNSSLPSSFNVSTTESSTPTSSSDVPTTLTSMNISEGSTDNTTSFDNSSSIPMTTMGSFNDSEQTSETESASEIKETTTEYGQEMNDTMTLPNEEGSGDPNEEEQTWNTTNPDTIGIPTSSPPSGAPNQASLSNFPWLDEQDQIYVLAGVFGAFILLLIIITIKLSCEISRLKRHCPLHYAVSESLLPLDSSPSIRPNEELAMRGFSQYNGHTAHPDRDGAFQRNMQGMDNFAYDEDPRIGKNASRKTFGGSSMY